MTERCVFDELIGQERVSAFLAASVRADRVSHAYLFVGPAGAGKKTAAKALACAVLCDDNGCGACGACRRVERGSHPDVHVISPEGASGYLVEQVRAIIHDVALAPVDGRRKIYLIDSADLFNDSSANAFLKTLEEPPDDVVIVLMAHRYESVLPTIASRCQVVRFRRIPTSEAINTLVALTTAPPEDARAALAAAGGVVPRARDMLESPARREAREHILRTLKDLASMDGLDVLGAAAGLLTAVRAPLDDVKLVHADEVSDLKEFAGSSAVKQLEARHKRDLTSREREGITEVLNVAESWLRDCLAMSAGERGELANLDAADAMEEVAAVLSAAAGVRALDAVRQARQRISYNVSPQLAIEAMLFEIQEVLRCPR